jgi:hypothetical protein
VSLPGDGWAFEILLILALAAHFHGQPGKMAIYEKPGKPGFFYGWTAGDSRELAIPTAHPENAEGVC